MRRASLAALTLTGAAALPTAIPGAFAQDLELPPGRSLTTTISQSLEADTNFDLDPDDPGTSFFGDTRVSFGFNELTDTRALFLGLDTGIRALDRADEAAEIVLASPSTARFTLLNEGPQTLLDSDLRLRSRQIDFRSDLDFVDDDFVPDVSGDLEGETTELRFDADVAITLGANAPSSYTFGLDGFVIDYEDTDETDLVPRREIEGTAEWELQLTPVLASSIVGSALFFDADDPEETEIQVFEVDAGLVYEPDETLRLRGGIGFADREREELVGGERETTESESGPVVRGDLRLVQDDFTLVADARVTTAAPETRLSGNLRGFYRLPRGRVTGRLFQRFTGGRGGDEERLTGGAIGVERDINAVSRVAFDFALTLQENEDDEDDDDITRTDLTASYIYDITQAVSTEVGYQFRTRDEGDEDADSHRVFVSIGRTFITGL